ncbi:hypothetical protein H8E52_12435 [bacterium]|nr:hypothetical protein [bacterium]
MGKLQFGPALARGWQIFTKDPLNLILGGLIAFIISLTLVLFPAMTAGYVYMVKRIAKGEKAELGDVFHGFNDFARYLVGGLIFLLAMLPAYLLGLATSGLGVIASAVVMGLLLPFWPLMVDKKLSGPEAFKEGLEFYKREYLTATIIALLFIALSFVAMLTFGVANLITVPITIAIMVAAYEQSYGFSDDEDAVREGEFEEVAVEPEPERKPEQAATPAADEEEKPEA